MASFDDDADRSGDESEDEEMEDVNDGDNDGDADADQDQDMDNQDDEEEDNEDNDDDDDDPASPPESPLRRQSRATELDASQQAADSRHPPNPAVVLTSPSPRSHASGTRSPAVRTSYIPPVRPEALVAQAYDIVPTMAAPQSTSINVVTATPDFRWVFSGGSDGYVRMFNWVETANGKVPLTVAQKHPFVDSVWKAGSLVTYWENEETSVERTPPQTDDGKWTSPVYSLAVHHEALWLLSGLESGNINLQTCRHQAGSLITTLREHKSAVSVLQLAQDEQSVLSGSWDKLMHDWDLNTGKVKRSFVGGGSQISTIEVRPLSSVAVPEVSADMDLPNGTFHSNNGDMPVANGVLPNGVDKYGEAGDEDAVGSPSGSLFGENDHGSLFGDDNDTGAGGGNPFGDDDNDDFGQAISNGLEQADADAAAPGEADTEMGGVGDGGPVQPPGTFTAVEEAAAGEAVANGNTAQTSTTESSDTMTNGTMPHSEERSSSNNARSDGTSTSVSELPPQSESTFLDAAFDGMLRIWDRRVPNPVATMHPYAGTPPWCVGACWSPDGNSIYAGRRNGTVDEYSMHKLGSSRSRPERVFRFQQGSGAVSAVRSMPNGRHLICASNDILRIYDLHQPASRRSQVPFTVVPGHRGGVIAAIYLDPACKFMLSAAGNRGWEGASTEVLLGYEIGIQNAAGVWHK